MRARALPLDAGEKQEIKGLYVFLERERKST